MAGEKLISDAAKKALKLSRRVLDYTDPASKKIEDWKWRPLPDVAKELNINEIPPHVQQFGDYMVEMADKAKRGEISDRDLIKAYTTTRASIQRRSQDTDKIREASGLPLVGAEEKIRPEGAWSEWLMSPAGQRYLDNAVKGEMPADTVESALSLMRSFGLAPTQINAMDWAAKNLPGRGQAASDLVYRASQKASPVSEWRDFTSDVAGVGSSKSGFLASLLGRGDLPTLDARQVILNTGLPTEASQKAMARSYEGQKGFGAQEGVDRLAARQEALELKAPQKYDPFYQHLTHHTIWDKASGEKTTHSDIMNAMRNAAVVLGTPAAGAAFMSEEQPVERASGGRLLQDEYPTQYMPNVGRQVMQAGGTTGEPMTIEDIIALIRRGGAELGEFDPRIPQIDASRAFGLQGSKFPNQAMPIIPTVPYTPDETSPRPLTVRGERSAPAPTSAPTSAPASTPFPSFGPIPPPRPRSFDAAPSAPATSSTPAAPQADDSVSRALWAAYNESESPADFLRADAAMREGRAGGGKAIAQALAAIRKGSPRLPSTPSLDEFMPERGPVRLPSTPSLDEFMPARPPAKLPSTPSLDEFMPERGPARLPSTPSLDEFMPERGPANLPSTPSLDEFMPEGRYAGGGKVLAEALAAIRNGNKVFPKPQRMFPEGARPPGGEYLNAATGEVITGQKPARAVIGVTPEGKPVFLTDTEQVDVTGSPGPGSTKTKTNLFKQQAGWKWAEAPEGYENVPTIVSAENRGKHYYGLGADFPKGVDLERYADAPSEPRLRPTTQGNVYPGERVGAINVRGREHPVYDMLTIRNILAGTGAGAAGAASMRDSEEGYAGGGKTVSKALKAVSELFDSPGMTQWREGSKIPASSIEDRYFTGTSKDKDFANFNVGRHGAWFTKDPADASMYARENDSKGYRREGWDMVPVNTADRVIPAFLRSENPFTGPLPDMARAENYKKAQSDWFDQLRAQGHDAWMPETDPNLAVILRDPSNIKSAISNTGEFDRASPRVDRAEGGEVGGDDYQSPRSRVRAALDLVQNQMAPQVADGEGFQRALQNYRNFPQQQGEATARPLNLDARDVIGGAIAGSPQRGETSYMSEMRRRAADALVGSKGLPGSGTLGFGLADLPMATGLPLMASDIAGSAGRGDYAEAALGAALPAAFYARQPIGKALGVARDALGRVPAPVAAGAAGAAVMSPDEAEAAKLRLPAGIKRIVTGTPEHDALKAQEAYQRIVSPFSEDPESVQRALQIASTYRVPQGSEFGTGSFFTIKPGMGVKDVQADIAPLPGVTPLDPRQMSWEDFAKQAKGGTMINVGGDRMNLGLLRDINNEKRLAWDVPLHAGPKYMLEPNPGMVWANAPGHTTSFNRIIREASEKGPVYGVYAPMGPTAVDSSVDMFNAVMSQLPTAKISSAAAKQFDKMVRNADFVSKVADRPRVAEMMKSQWPGLSNLRTQEEVLALAQKLTGTQRGDLVKAMDKATRRKEGFPDIGATRVAVTDPALLSAPSNTIGHRIVRFDTEGLVTPERKFPHPSYPAESLGTYVGDVPLVQTQYGMPTAMDKLLAARTKKGEVMHPYSIDPMGRSSARKMFTEQKQRQPVDDQFIESIMLGLERQKKYGLKKGGSVSHRALMLASSNT